MIKTGDKLICTDGNACYETGKTYTVGEFVNRKFFELMTDCNHECWYASINDEGIYVHFNSIKGDQSDAKFHKLETRSCA